MSNGDLFRQSLKKRILILDGATGTMIQQMKLSEADFRGDLLKKHCLELKGNNELLSLTRPDIIEKIHIKYLEAGADIIECNTFCANAISQSSFKLKDYAADMNRAAVRIARKAANYYTSKNPDKPRFIAGSLGPTNKSLSTIADIDTKNKAFESLKQCYYEQANILSKEGVDIFLIETIYDIYNAQTAIQAVKEVLKEQNKNIPLMVSVSINNSYGKLQSGETLEEFYKLISYAEPDIIGLNCSTGAEDISAHIKELAGFVPCAVSVYANAGFPDKDGNYPCSPQKMADVYENLAKSGCVNICGGCCGTTPEYIQAISERLKQYSPKIIY